MYGSIALIVLGLFGVFAAGRGVVTGEISVVWSMLGGWGRVSSTHSKEESPLLFWGATVFYGGAGLALALFGVYRLLAAPG
jgi:hypothetical protein